MKKYILKLLNEDLELQNQRLDSWNNMLDRFKSDDYQIRRKLSIERKIKKVSRYIERIESEL